jgi:hypothetical protein
MKKTLAKYSLILITLTVLAMACSRRIEDSTPRLDDFGDVATVQLYNVAVGNQRNLLYVDGKPVNGATVPLLYTNTIFTPLFPAAPNVGFAVTAGVKNFSLRDTLSTSVQPQLSFAENFDGNKFYTIFAYDTMSAVKQKTVETNIVVPSDNSARVRFANFAFLKSGVPPPVDIFSKVKNANIFTNIAMTDVTDFITYTSGVADTLIVRSTGTAIGLDTANFTFNAKRNYTLVFRGRYGFNESGGATFPRTLSSFINY